MFKEMQKAAATEGSGWKAVGLSRNLSDPAPVFKEAQELANQGKFVVIAYQLDSGPGHVAVVVPSPKLYRSGNSWGQAGVPYLAQAGTSKDKFGNKSVFDA